MNSDLHLDDMLMFYRVAGQKGFNAASRQFGMSKQTISRRIAMLEANLGVKLIERNTRNFELTPAGRTYFEDCLHVISEAQQANRRIKETKNGGAVLKISLPGSLVHKSCTEILKQFCNKNPHVRVNLLDQSEIFDANDLDIQIYIDSGSFQDVTAANLGVASFGAFASPDYLAQISSRSGHEPYQFIASNEKIQPGYLKYYPDADVSLRVNSFAQVLQAASAGFGVGYLPVGLARSAIQGKILCPVSLQSSTNSFPVKMKLNAAHHPKECATAFFEHLVHSINYNQIWDGVVLSAVKELDEHILDDIPA